MNGDCYREYVKRLVEYKQTCFSGFVYDMGIYQSKYHEVIGIIHDNPELMEKE